MGKVSGLAMITAGIDSGISSTKVAVLKDGRVIAAVAVPAHLESADRVAEKALTLACAQAALSRQEIQHTVVCGRGSAYVRSTNERVPEFVCLARGVGKTLPSVRTVIDLGAEKSLVVTCSEGRVTNTAKNDRCAAGTGSFLEMVTRLLRLSRENVGVLPASPEDRIEISSTCAIFAESEIISLLHSKVKPEAILAGVYHNLAARLYPLLLQVRFQKDVAMVGGLALDIGIRNAIEEQLGFPMIVPGDPLVVNAIGAAVIAEEKLRSAS